jgi:transmembrane protein
MNPTQVAAMKDPKMNSKLSKALESNALWLCARILLAIVFLSGGLAKLILFNEGVAEMRTLGLEPAWLLNLIVGTSLTIGALLILLDRYLCLAAAGLSTFLVLTIVVVHRFWAMEPPQAMLSMYVALEHISLIGGLIGTAIASHFRRTMLLCWNHNLAR